MANHRSSLPLVITIIFVLLMMMWGSYGIGFMCGADSAQTESVTTYLSGDDFLESAMADFQSKGYDDSEDTVYWVSSGSVWHTTPDCRALSNSLNVHEGSIEESGKERACKLCG